MPVDRPVYILAHQADMAGCGHHRMTRPMELLARSGMIAGRCDMNIWQDGPLVAMSPDVVVWQRQHEDAQIAAMERYRKALPNAFMVYELDDSLADVPDLSYHKSFIPFDVNDRMVRAIAHCDAISVSTKTLADKLRLLVGKDFDIRIAPNMLGRDELTNITEIRKTRRYPIQKPRIGWGGGISHTEDLQLLLPAIEEFRDRVQWVFIGMIPETDVPLEVHDAVQPREYLAKLASLDLDLVLAPAVDCEFNRCKSNLRLLEAGACGYPVIASPITPYREGNPPVFSYAADDEWTSKIGQFLDATDHKNNALTEWLNKKFIFDDHVEERLKMWLPRSKSVFKPKHNSITSDNVIIVSALVNEVPDGVRVEKDLDAVANSPDDILYLRPGTSVTSDQIKRLKARLAKGPFASVTPISNDGGLCTFPKMGQFHQIEEAQGKELDSLCTEMFQDISLEVPFPSGPVLLISRKVINKIGMPVNTTIDELEANLIEWGVGAAARGFPNIVASDVYSVATVQMVFGKFAQVLQRIQFRWPPMQMPADPLKEARAHLEMAYHKKYYKMSPPSSVNNYAEWAPTLDELGDRDKKFLLEENNKEHDIKLNYFTYPLNGVFQFEQMEDKEWLVFYDAKSNVVMQASYLLREAIKANPSGGLIYSDHDFINAQGERDHHDFKPIELDYSLLLARDYITPFFAINVGSLRTVLDMETPTDYEIDSPHGGVEVGEERVEAALNFGRVPLTEVDLYRLVLRAAQHLGKEGCVHIPWILAHLPTRSPEEVAEITAKKIIEANKFLETDGQNISLSQSQRFPQYADVSYKPIGKPLVSIIICAGGRVEMLSPCIGTMKQFIKYPNYEIIIINDGTVPKAMQEYQETLKGDPKIKILRWNYKFNWSTKNDFGVKNSNGEYLLFLNDDTRFMEGDWLSEMVGAAQQPKAGAIGARLVYPHGLIQHVGVVCHHGLAGHLSKTIPESQAGYNGIAMLSHECTAVTGACLMVSRKLYEEVGGFDKRFAHNFNDVVFCLELNRRGYVNILPAKALLQHVEGVTRASPIGSEGMELQIQEGKLLKEYMEPDRYWNHNLFFAHLQGGLFVSGLTHDILTWRKEPWPWRGEDWHTDGLLMLGCSPQQWTDAVRNGDKVYQAFANGFHVKIIRPTIDNIPEFDIRDRDRAKIILAGLGVTKIMVGTLLGGIVEILSFVANLGIDVMYSPVNAESVCPRTNFQGGDGSSCDLGYRRGICGQCIKENNSPFGVVQVAGWRASWKEFLEPVEIDYRYIPPEGKDAISEVFQK